MKERIVNIIGTIAGWFVPVFLLIVLTLSFVRSVLRFRQSNVLIEKTQKKIEKQEEENQRLAEQLKVIQSEEFIEKQLRDKLGLAKEGEIILVLPDKDVLRKLSPSILLEEEVKPLSNVEKWLRVFDF